MESYQLLSNEEFELLKSSINKKIIKMDVRSLEMPLPMITIMKAIENLTANEFLLIDHFKIPQILFNEIAARNLSISITKIEDSHIQILIHS